MRMVLTWLGLLLVTGVGLLLGWRALDTRADLAEMDQLVATQPEAPARFSSGMVAELPEPSRRYFTYTISEGAPLFTVARIEMEGSFALGTKDAPNYMNMRATQILAPPHGFLWKMSGGSGVTRVSGSDSGNWTRFWLAGLLPVARSGGTADHARSAFGRFASEAAIWAPAALLPGPGVTWQDLGPDVARVTVREGDLEQTFDLSVDAEGRPIEVSFERWTNANAEKVFRLQPFGARMSDFRDVGGYRLPFHVEAGNMFGTEDYFPFFIAEVTEIGFPGGE